MPKTVLVIQARMGSKRCPGKMLIPIEGIPLIQLVYDRCKKSSTISQILVATSDQKTDDDLAKYCRKQKIPFIRGPENDVLARFEIAAKKTKADHIIRICGDQPFTDSEIIDRAVQEHLAKDADYTATVLEPTFPKGVDVEVVRASILLELARTSQNPSDREHVTLTLRRETNYKRHSITASQEQTKPDLNLCIDTPKDLRYTQTIAKALGPFAKTEKIIHYVINHQELQKKPLILFRADGGWKQGMGHLATCFDLAEELRENFEITFLAKENPEATNAITKKGYKIITLPRKLRKESKKAIEIINAIRPEIYFTDLLSITENYAEQLRKLNVKMITNDILGETIFEADVIINRSKITERINHYPTDSKTYIGPEYAILNPDFANIPDRKINSFRNVLLTFGGSDPKRILLKTLKAIHNIPEINITAIIGSAYKHNEELKKTLDRLSKKINLVENAHNMKELYLESDLAIASGGRTLYELACTGTPAIIICAEQHQMINAKEFESCTINLGMAREVSTQKIKETIGKLTVEELNKMSENGRKLVDGKGLERVKAIMEEMSK